MALSPDIQRIIDHLKECQMHVTEPTIEDGEAVYRINEHALTEREIRKLAAENLLTTWGIFSYVRVRDQGRMR